MIGAMFCFQIVAILVGSFILFQEKILQVIAVINPTMGQPTHTETVELIPLLYSAT